MATLNKQSLREEFDALKGRFVGLSGEDKMPAETRALCEALLALFELLIAVFMEKNTPKDSTNSSKPSSQTPNDETASTRAGTKGKGPVHSHTRCANTRTVETVQVAEVVVCEGCGEDLSATACARYDRRTQIDIIFEKVVRHVDAEVKGCPRCQTQTRGAFPKDMPGLLQYGSGIKAYVLNLLIAQMLSLKRVQHSLQTLIDMAISQATILNYVMRLHHALAMWERSAIEQLLAQPAMHVDETSLRVDKKNHWIHVCSAGEITLKFLHPKRGCEAIEAIGVIPRYRGVVIHDCWASYLTYHHCGHGLCGSHLLRELTFIVDANGYRWAKNMKRLLQETCLRVSKRKRKKLTARECKNLHKRYRNILTRGARELPPIPPKQNGKRGRVREVRCPQSVGAFETARNASLAIREALPMYRSPTIEPNVTCE